MSVGLWRVFEEQVVDGKYVLRRLLGVGSYGGVFLADEVVADRLIRQVAVKLMETDEARQAAQMQELIVAANLDHPHLLRSITCGACELNRVPLLYLVTELAEETLDETIQRATLPAADARTAAVAIASALVYLHGQSFPLVHRDLKPANVMRVKGTWKLGDFGLVSAGDGRGSKQTGAMAGTAAYAPPESYRGEVSPAWDQWSLGALLAEALTGRLPFEGDSPHRLMIAVSSEEPTLPADLPEPFGRIVRGCLQRDPAARWTARQVVEALSADTASAVPPPVARLPEAFYATFGLPEASTASPPPLVVSPSEYADFRTLTEAVLGAPAHATIRVLPGTYRGQIVLDRPVTIEGVGGRGAVHVEARGGPCIVMRTSEATVRGLSVTCRPDPSTPYQSHVHKYPAIDIGQGTLTLDDCEIVGAAAACVSIHGPEARPLLRGCRIYGGKTGGVSVSDRAAGALEDCEVFGHGGVGVEVSGGASPHLARCAVHDCHGAGISFEAAGGRVEDCAVHANSGIGISIGAGAHPEVVRCRVFLGEQTGISIRNGGLGALHECEIHGHVLSNVIISQSANPTLTRCRIYDGHSNGVWVSQAGQGVIEECSIYGNAFAGVKVSHGGSPLLRRTTLRDGKRTGISVHERSRATLIDCDIAANAQSGLFAETGAQVAMRGCIVRDGRECGVWLASDAALEACDIFANAGAGVELRPGGKAELRACRIHDGAFVGVLAKEGAEAILESCDVYANALPGVAIGEQSRVDLRACRIYDGKQLGVVFWDRGMGVVEDCDIHGNALGGIRIRQGSDPLIRNCRINGNEQLGVHVSEASEGAVIDCDLTGNRLDGLFVEAGCTTQSEGNRM
ncbi:MAG TPA: right-handed parallel beta-helix repeat-containing protein [Chthonomonadaceae bacterium]|nr:right-handed parallel beta-helix repeat-containing protein [Chthonomonadaceae bacterium]